MRQASPPSWVEGVRLPFDHHRARISGDWQTCAQTINRVAALEAYEPIGEGPFRHRSAHLDLGCVQALAVAQTDIVLRGRRCRPGRAFLRLPLVGSIAVRQARHSFTLAPGRASFDCDDSSAYEARTDGSALLVLSLDPRRIASAAALLRGPQEDPAPWLARLPEQRLLGEDLAALPLLTSQIERILNLADQLGGPDRSVVSPRLAELLERAVALMVFPELIRQG